MVTRDRDERLWLLLVAVSAAGFVVAVVLHNVVSALFRVEEPVLFVIAVLVAPTGALTGALGAALRRRRR